MAVGVEHVKAGCWPLADGCSLLAADGAWLIRRATRRGGGAAWAALQVSRVAEIIGVRVGCIALDGAACVDLQP